MKLMRILYIGSIGAVIANAAFASWVVMRGEPMHAIGHGAAALVFLAAAFWLQRRQKPAPTATERRDPRLDVLEDEVSELRRELSNTRDTLSFTEQMLAQRPRDTVDRREPND